MIEGIEPLYRVIADSIKNSIPEPWSIATVESIFFPDSITIEAEYVSLAGKARSFGTSMDCDRAFEELRDKFKEAQQPIWGQARFELHSDGKFNMKWGYDNCDENGDTIWDEEQQHQRFEERRHRLSRP